MTIKLITGIPGSGKTLFAVSELKKVLEENQTAQEPRNIYCDITGLKVSDMPAPPIDWRTTPPRSLLIYDEAQFHEEFKPRRGANPYKCVEELTIHRKTGHELWFITQDPKRLHNDILLMVEQHYHLERPYGAKLATIYRYRGYERNPSGVSVKQRAEAKSLFNYDRRLFELYESAQVADGIKFRMPKEIVFWLGVLAVVCVFFYYQVTSDGMKRYLNMTQSAQDKKPPQNAQESPTVSETPTAALQAQEPPLNAPNEATADNRRVYYYTHWLPKDYELIKSDPNLQVRGVVQMGDICRVYNTYGDLMSLSPQECAYYIAQSGRVHKPNQPQNAPQTPQQALNKEPEPIHDTPTQQGAIFSLGGDGA